MKWTKKASDHLEKLNSDCNVTTGLEAKLLLAVGHETCCITTLTPRKDWSVVYCTLDLKCVSVHFDHFSEPYKVETQCRVDLWSWKNYRQYFPLILVYAVTIHKCQDLSLDCAIVDMSDRVFSAGMAYVALSRVR